MPTVLAMSDFDLATRSASGFLLRYIAPRVEPVQLLGMLVRRLPFRLSAPQSDIIIGVGHGGEDVFTGQNETIILEVGRYAPREVEGKVIKLLSCQCGVELVPDLVVNGAACAMGYCMPEDTLIISNPVPKQISSIKVGDTVLGHDGRFHRVSQCSKRKHNGELIEITPWTLSIPIRLTPNHQILVKRKRIHWNENVRPYQSKHRKKTKEIWDKEEPEWLPASEVKRGDFLLLPIMQVEEKVPEFTVSNILEAITVKGNLAYTSHRSSICHPIANHIKITPDLMRLIGYHIADGCLQKPRNKTINLDFNGKKESRYAYDVEGIIQSNFGFSPIIKERGSVIRVSIHSRILGQLFERWCGDGAGNKRIPDWAISLPEQYLSELVKGLWRGDGHFTKSKGRINFAYDTISKALALQICNTLLRLGIMPSLCEAKQSGKGNHNLFRITVHGYGIEKISNVLGIPCDKRRRPRSEALLDGDYMYLPIKSIKTIPFNDFVYNLAVEEVNSYISSVFSVHNCDDYIWVVDADLASTPWADELAATNLMPVVDGLNALLDGKTAREALDIELESYSRNAEVEEDELVKACLEFNRDNAILIGDGDAKVRARPSLALPFKLVPPPPLLLPIRG